MQNNESQGIIYTMPCKGGKTYEVTNELANAWQKAYPSVEMINEFDKMRAWLLSNASRIKTKRGMPRFINNWLSKAQNNGNWQANSGARQQGGSSAIERARANIDAARQQNLGPMGSDAGNVREPMDKQVWGDSRPSQSVDGCIEGEVISRH